MTVSVESEWDAKKKVRQVHCALSKLPSAWWLDVIIKHYVEVEGSKFCSYSVVIDYPFPTYNEIWKRDTFVSLFFFFCFLCINY